MDWVGAQTVCDLLAIYAGIGPLACVSFVAESDGEHSDQDVRDAAARPLELTVDCTKAERVKVFFSIYLTDVRLLSGALGPQHSRCCLLLPGWRCWMPMFSWWQTFSMWEIWRLSFARSPL